MKDDRGSVVVEALLVVPVMMLILLAVVQFALWAHAAQVAQLAASEGDRVARSPGTSPGAGTAVGTAAAVAAGVNRARYVMEGPGSDLESAGAFASTLPGDRVRISVTGTALPILPGLSLPVSATVVGPVQEFRASE
ncbi:MAG TPA: TadE family protein [Acidimicrobiales bacterium]|nr:TadE family protein [Acidimicrobiales bacterium]